MSPLRAHTARAAATWQRIEQWLNSSIRTLPRALRERARLEPPGRRMAWAALAALMVCGPVLFNLARETRFTATVEIFPRPVSSFPPIRDPTYYLSRLDDPRVQSGMAQNVGAPFDEYRRAAIRRSPAGPLLLSVTSVDPTRAQQLVNALGPQIVQSTQQQLVRQVASEQQSLRIQLAVARRGTAERRAVVRRVRTLRAIQPESLPPRAVLGPRPPRPALHNVADRVADALPGEFRTRSNPVAAGLAGLLIVATLYVIGLMLFPPGASELAAARPPGRLSRLLSRVPSIGLPRGVPVGILTVAGIALVAVVMALGRDLTTFRLDEWSFVLDRQGNSLSDFLRPHNEHLSLVPVIVFKALLATVGMAPYWPYRLAVAVVAVSIGILLYLYARPRLGRGWAIAPAILTMLVGQGAYDVIWPFQIGFDISVACGVGMLLCFDRPGPRSDLVAGGLLLVALCSSSIGIAVAAAAVVEVLASPGRRRERALRILAVPLFVYIAWWLRYQPTSDTGGASPIQSVRLLADVSGAAGSSLFGVPISTRRLFAVAVLVAVAVGLVLRRGERRALIVACAAPASYWLLLVLERGSTGALLLDSRYILPGSVLLACVLCELLRGSTARARPWVAVPVALGVVLAMSANIDDVQTVSKREASVRSEPLRAKLAALSIAGQGRPVDPSFGPAPAEVPIYAGTYFPATERFGDPVPNPDRVIRGLPVPLRNAADRTYLAAAPLRPVPVATPHSTDVAGCVTTVSGPNELPIPRAGLFVRAPRRATVPVAVRRWGVAPVSIGDVGPGWAALKPSRDGAQTRLRVSIAFAGLRVCRVGA